MGARDVSRRAFLIGGAGGAMLLVGGGPAAAGTARRAPRPPIPAVIDCAGWGARPNRDVVPVVTRRPVRIIVHHTADPNGADASRDAATRIARGVQNFHMDVRGWIDSGQNFTISRGGFVLEGRHRSLEALRSGRFHIVGAHCTGQNDVAVGIENEGTYGRATPPRPQLDRLRELCAAICARYGINPAEIRGHREFRDTACPGNRLYGLLPQLRVDVGRLIGVPLAAAEATRPVWPLVRPGDQGPPVLAAQHLLRGAGHGDVDPDGRFGPTMETSVRRFQSDRHCEEVNGVIGGETWPLLTGHVSVDHGTGASAVAALRGGAAARLGPVRDELAWQRLLGAVG